MKHPRFGVEYQVGLILRNDKKIIIVIIIVNIGGFYKHSNNHSNNIRHSLRKIYNGQTHQTSIFAST